MSSPRAAVKVARKQVKPAPAPRKKTDAPDASKQALQLADEIVSVLASDPNATVRLVVEISAQFPEGASDELKRAVTENARTLGLKSADWE